MNRLAAFLIMAIASGGRAGVAHADGAAALAAIDLGAPRMFAFNEATVSSKNGIAGSARLSGTSVDGVRVTLCETTVGFAESLSLTYYAWPELAELTFEGTDGDGLALAASVRLRKEGGGTQTDTGIWLDTDVATLATLEFPFRQPALGTPRLSITVAELNAGGQKQAARRAAAELFLPGRRVAPSILLSLWSVAVIAGAMLWRSARVGAVEKVVIRSNRRGTALLAVLAFAVFAASATAFAIGAAPAELYAVAIEEHTGSRTPDSGPSALTRHVSRADTYRGITWKTEDERGARPGGLWLLGIRSPQSAAVPVSAFDGFRRLRFKYPPLIIAGPEGRPTLAPAPLTLAWGLHE